MPDGNIEASCVCDDAHCDGCNCEIVSVHGDEMLIRTKDGRVHQLPIEER